MKNLHGCVAAAVALTTLAIPASAAAYTVTVKVHGAGAVTELTDRHLMDCTVGPDGRSESSITNCVAGTPSGNYQWGDIVNLRASVPAAASDRGWRFQRWVDGTASGQINCDPQPTTGNHLSETCQFQIFENLHVDLYFGDEVAPNTSLSGGPTGVTKETSAA